jgi:hypothetical protein
LKITIWFKLKDKQEEELKFMLPNLLVKLLMLLLIIKMILNYKFLWTAEMMLSILEQYGWDHLLVSQQKLYLILVLNILLLQVFFVMIQQPEILNLKNMTHFLVVSFKETNNIKDVKQCLMICIDLIQIKFFLKLHQN